MTDDRTLFRPLRYIYLCYTIDVLFFLYLLLSADSCCPFCEKNVYDGSSSVKIGEKGAKGINSKSKDYGDSLIVVNGDIVYT